MSRFIEPNLNPPDCDDSVSDLQEKVGILLEDADIPTAVCDQIMVLIAKAERDKFMAHSPFTTDEVE